MNKDDMKIDFYSYTNKGGRPVNEDSVIAKDNCFVVSDGLGGHRNGEIASNVAVNYIAENFRSDISNVAISRLLTDADNAVRRYGKGGKATVAAVFIDGSITRIDNIGDSRVYYFRDGNIYFRTKDHSICQAVVDMGEMTDDDVRNSADRSVLFKVLGDTEPLKLPKPYETIEPQDGDAFLICSDGFWEHIYDKEMESDLQNSDTPREWLEKMLKRLLLRSKDNGDNYTAICGIIYAPNDISQTESADCTSQVSEIPVTLEMADTARTPPAIKPIVICCAVVAAVIIGAAAALIMLNGNKKSSDGTLSKQQTVSGSVSESSFSESRHVILGISDISNDSENSDGSDISDSGDILVEPDTSNPRRAHIPSELSNFNKR